MSERVTDAKDGVDSCGLSRRLTSRREFLAQAAVGGVSAASASAMRPGSAKAQPKKGGTFRFGSPTGALQDSLSPELMNSWTDYFTSNAIRNSLTEISNSGELIPELAESWDVSADSKTWRFDLRKGVEFHNGRTFEAEDARYSLNFHRREASRSAAKILLDPIQDIRTDGKHRLIVELRDGDADFAFMMSDFRIPMLIDGTKSEEMTARAIGTGAFVLDSYEPGVRGSLHRNPNYWKEGRGHFDALETLVITDVAARTAALKTGEIDYMNRCDRKTLRSLGASGEIEVIATTGNQHYTLPMNTQVAPFEDNNVRLALKYAVDRQELVQKILNGYGAPANDHPIGPANRYFAKDLPQRQYDPDKAKFYLKRAGLESLRVEITLAEAAFAGAVDAGLLYSEQAARAGIDITVTRAPEQGYWNDVWMKVPWCAAYYGGRPTENWMFSWIYASGAAWNETYWEHARFNRLLGLARAEQDDSKRRQMYYEMQQIVRNEGGSVIPMYASYVEAISSRVKHDPVIGNNLGSDGLKAMERWWFA